MFTRKRIGGILEIWCKAVGSIPDREAPMKCHKEYFHSVFCFLPTSLSALRVRGLPEIVPISGKKGERLRVTRLLTWLSIPTSFVMICEVLSAVVQRDVSKRAQKNVSRLAEGVIRCENSSHFQIPCWV